MTALATDPRTITKRKEWFAAFGYKDGTTVTLQNGLGDVHADLVWHVLSGLRSIEAELDRRFFEQLGRVVFEGGTLSDRNGEYQREAFGAFCGEDGKIKQEYRAALMALLRYDPGERETTFARQPLVQAGQAKGAHPLPARVHHHTKARLHRPPRGPAAENRRGPLCPSLLCRAKP